MSSRGRERGRERAWQRWPTDPSPSHDGHDGPLLVPGFQIGDATSRLGNRYKEAWRTIHHEWNRAYDERARDFAESRTRLVEFCHRLPPPPLSFLPYLTRKFGIEVERRRTWRRFACRATIITAFASESLQGFASNRPPVVTNPSSLLVVIL